MSEIRVFLVELDNNKDVYFPGDIVAGNIVLELYSPMQIQELNLTFTGEAKVEWWDICFNVQGESEQYFKQSVVVLEKDEERKDGHDVQEGANKYPFTFELPPKLPTSFEDSSGHVRYFTEARLVTNMWHDYIGSSRAITIISPLDLNEIDNVKVPCEEQVVKNLCGLCCKSGPITGILRLERTGYIPGETINVNVEFRNMSRYTCDICVLGIQTVKYPKTSKIKTENCFCRGVDRAIHPGDSETLLDELVIQPIPPSWLEGCGIISIDYHVQLTVTPDGGSLPFNIKQRIIIGTIPLQSVVEKYNIEYMNALSMTPTTKDFPLIFKESKYAVMIHNGLHTFRAKYPYYDWLKKQSITI
ncbi:unnamed protein product [Mytilus coruscus]|uniref:Arrestin C-terminal-like domain-containing protein n=1 Tax=Mytilus coruscus TaxID=42192 RepID=A0A6J8B2H5_MYTCO|nr:unnamed protein product [Mytilus coruscus]